MAGRPDRGDYSLLLHSHEDSTKYEELRRRRRLILVVVVLLVVFGAVIVGLYFAGRSANNGGGDAGVHKYEHAAVASDVAQCSEIGKDLLVRGGNAVDAAVGSLLCMGLADAQSMGIGGGFFMTIYNRTTGTTVTIDGRETAPGAATEDMFHGNPNASSLGRLSIAVPGEVRGLWMAHQKYGRLPWSELFAPAIQMAEFGFKVPRSLAHVFQNEKEDILNEPSLREVYVNKDTGDVYKEGETLKLPRLAASLKTLAQGGEQAFYNGSLTDDIMADLKDIGSIITRQDLVSYQALLKEPVQITLNSGLRVFSPPPPSSGAVLSFILNILDGYNMTASDLDGTERSVLTMHRIVEAFKFAYAKRTDLADEDFVNVTALVANLTSHEYADEIRSQITDNSTHNTSYYGPTFYDQLTTSTAHLSVVDAEGSAVSVTDTINGHFGSHRRGSRTGIVFNNEMDDFSSPNITNDFGFPPSPANFIKPGKRPLSSMCPAILVTPDGDVRLVVGAAGGSRITTSTAFVAVHELWLGQGVDQAVSDLRLHHQLLPVQLLYEEGFDQAILDGLAKLGHQLESTTLGHSVVQAISRHDGRLYAASDFRKGGQPSGY